GRESLVLARLRRRCRCRARSVPRRRRTAAGDPSRDREHPRVFPLAHCQRGVLSTCGLRRAAARSLAARGREGALTMTAGLPGTGIGGMFYLISALATPLREAYLRVRGRRSRGWKPVVAQTAIAGAILASGWATGWLLRLALNLSRRPLPPAPPRHPDSPPPVLPLPITGGTL